MLLHMQDAIDRQTDMCLDINRRMYCTSISVQYGVLPFIQARAGITMAPTVPDISQ
jgi:hypothetical protein